MTTNDAYVWECANGHEVAVSEVAMRTTVFALRCPYNLPDGPPCGAKLVRRLRDFPVLEGPDGG